MNARAQHAPALEERGERLHMLKEERGGLVGVECRTLNRLEERQVHAHTLEPQGEHVAKVSHRAIVLGAVIALALWGSRRQAVQFGERARIICEDPVCPELGERLERNEHLPEDRRPERLIMNRPICAGTHVWLIEDAPQPGEFLAFVERGERVVWRLEAARLEAPGRNSSAPLGGQAQQLLAFVVEFEGEVFARLKIGRFHTAHLIAGNINPPLPPVFHDDRAPPAPTVPDVEEFARIVEFVTEPKPPHDVCPPHLPCGAPKLGARLIR
jgi:hypothetical protein